MKTEFKEQISDALKAQMETLGLSMDLMGKRIGDVSASTINNIVNKKYDNPALMPSDKMWNRIAAFLGLRKDWVLVEDYHNFKRVQVIANHAKVTHVAHAIISPPGLGKSATLKKISETTKNVFYIECDEHWSKKVLLNKLKQAMGLHIEAQGINDMFDDIVNHLATLDSPLIIIDEADMLKDGVLSLFVSLYNKTLGHCGFVISGSLYLRARIEKGVRLNKQAYNNIFSRIGKDFIVLHPLDAKQIAGICIANDISDPNLITRVTNVANNDLRSVKAEIDKIKLEIRRAA